MSYPTLPFALVHFLAGASKERASLRKGPRHVTIAAQHGKGVRSRRYEVETDDNWISVLQGAVALYTEGPVDTMALIYPTTGNDQVDLGIIIEKGREPMVFQWNYGNDFNLWLIDEGPNVDQLKNGVGVQEVLALMNQDHGITTLRLPEAAPIPAVLAAPARIESPIGADYQQDH